MTDRAIGWVLVVVQFALLAAFGALALLDGRSDWARPWWVAVPAIAVTAIGAVLATAAARALGTALTPTPEPRAGAALRDDGPYRWSRHPIYGGVLLVVAGVRAWAASWPALALGAAIVAFFVAKSGWEERRLRAAYPGYAAYAARTPRFLPRPRRPRRTWLDL